jgi:hypothetical protein
VCSLHSGTRSYMWASRCACVGAMPARTADPCVRVFARALAAHEDVVATGTAYRRVNHSTSHAARVGPPGPVCYFSGKGCHAPAVGSVSLAVIFSKVAL